MPFFHSSYPKGTLDDEDLAGVQELITPTCNGLIGNPHRRAYRQSCLTRWACMKTRSPSALSAQDSWVSLKHVRGDKQFLSDTSRCTPY